MVDISIVLDNHKVPYEEVVTDYYLVCNNIGVVYQYGMYFIEGYGAIMNPDRVITILTKGEY